MCSNDAERIAQIGQAIDDLAAEALTAYAPASGRPPARPGSAAAGSPDTGQERSAGHSDASLDEPTPDEPTLDEPTLAAISDADQVVIRLAELWALLAALDPEVARRLPIYEA